MQMVVVDLIEITILCSHTAAKRENSFLVIKF
jgi:hypothetical protein